MTNPNNNDFSLIDDEVDIPGVDLTEIPGVEMDKATYAGDDTAPQNVESDDLDIASHDPSSVSAENTTDAAENTTDVAKQIITQDETRRSTRIRTQTMA
jgi:hypothetical protein